MEDNKNNELEKKNVATHAVVVKNDKSRVFYIVIAVVLVSFLAGLAGSYVHTKLLAESSGSGSYISADQDGNAVISSDEADVAAVAEAVAPSVVSIVTSGSYRSGYTYYPQQQSGAGTGVVLSKNGYILTNNHVIDGAGKVSVVTSSGDSYDNVRIIGRDPLNDIAFLKVSGVSDLTPAVLGDSKSVRIGQRVVAIGNALGQFQNTVTSGIISGVGRSVAASTGGPSSGEVEQLSDLIQTDAAINSGNSGGPLVNMSGQVIGINTAVASDANSVGFVIPISSTKGMISGLLDTGKVSRAYIGVRYLNITPEVARVHNLPVKRGAYIFSDDGRAVVSRGPADRAGIKNKDIIVKVGDVDVGSQGSVATLVGEYKPGSEVEMTVLRGNDRLNLKVKLVSYDD